jgi:DNA polymerase-4
LSWRKFRQKAIVIPSEAEEPAVQPTGDFTGCLDSARHDEAIFGATYCHVDEESRPRSIIHLDMDCFYAAIEVRDRPSLRGKPVAVGGARDRRGVLTTCNYEARKFGVRSAMPTFMALQRCPDLIVLPTRFDVYRREAGVIRGILYRFTSLIEPLSLDEAYLDISAHPGAPGPLAQVIRGTIFRETKLTSSAGIGPNKLIAKIASEMNKPNGQFEVKPKEVPRFMQDLPVRKIWGIGEKTERKLEDLGVKTCGELQRFSRSELVDLFGKFGLDLYDLCRGIDDRPVEPDRPRKSLSTEETFAVDLTTLEQCEEKLEELFQDLMADLAQKESTRDITKIFVKLKFSDFTRTTAERAGLAPALPDFRSLLDEAFARTGKPVRLIGVGVRFAEAAPENAQMDLL